MKKLVINNVPNADSLWDAIGGYHDTFSQIVNEFIDDAISSFIGNNLVSRNIVIHIKDNGKKKRVVIEDTGAGIKNLDAAFTLGSKECKESPLNEHGIGMKHALSSANPGNDSWVIRTRTEEDLKKSAYKQISAKYSFGGFSAEIIHDKWPGLFNQTGTIIQFDCENEIFETLAKGRQGGLKAFDRFVDALIEDIGYTYAGIIKDGKATISIITKDTSGKERKYNVAAIEPDLEKLYKPGIISEKCDLGGGTVELQYCFGRINDRPSGKYYRRKMSSSGCEIRINGRILTRNLFREIWDAEKHPSYNSLHVSVNVVSDNINALPRTLTSKNGFREGDKKLIRLYKEIRKKMPTPRKDERLFEHETEIFEVLAEKKRVHMIGSPTVNTEQRAYVTLGEGVKMDLYVASPPDSVAIYEGKRGKTSPKDLYQLMMYWDGTVLDGINVTDAILLGIEHPESVHRLIEHLNTRSDISGRKYNFTARLWEDEGIEVE